MMYSTSSLPPIRLLLCAISTSVLVQIATMIPFFNSSGMMTFIASFT